MLKQLPNFFEFNLNELKVFLESIGLKKFVAVQLFE
jgi:hypothetical protein